VAFRQQKRAFVLSDEPSVAGKEKGKRNFLSPQIEMEKGSMATKISEEFGCRPDTLRERLVNALQRRYRRQVASAQLIKAVSGARSKDASHSSLASRPFTQRNFDAGQLLRA